MSLTWRVIGEVLTRVQLELDRSWTLEEMAADAGYEATHFAHSFAELVGTSPARYVRMLRIERAAFALAEQPERSVLEIGVEAGYTSAEAFSRAFRRAAGASPSAFRQAAVSGAGAASQRPTPLPLPPLGEAPEGLDLTPAVEMTGPIFAVRAVARWEPGAIAEAFLGLASLSLMPDPGRPWVFGGFAQPWGWTGGPLAPELNCLRFTDAPVAALAPPHLPWRLRARWMLRFDYRGSLLGSAVACEWIVRRWIPAAGLRPVYWPVLTRVEHVGVEPAHLRIFVAASDLRRLRDDGA